MADEIEKTYHEALERGKKEGFVPIIVFISDILYDEIMKEFNIVTGEEISINYINSKRKELIDIASDSEGKKWLENTLQKKMERIRWFVQIQRTSGQAVKPRLRTARLVPRRLQQF